MVIVITIVRSMLDTNEITSSSEVKESKIITLNLTEKQYNIVRDGLQTEWINWLRKAGKDRKAKQERKAAACDRLRRKVFEVEEAIDNQLLMKELPGVLA